MLVKVLAVPAELQVLVAVQAALVVGIPMVSAALQVHHPA